MQTLTPLEPGYYYHIYNRGVNKTNTFIEDRNFAYFMQLYAKHIAPVADTFAYCLMPNHFHFLVRIRTDRLDAQVDRLGFKNRVGLDILDRRAVSQAFNNWLNAYAKAIKLERAMVLNWFGGVEGLQRFHALAVNESSISELIGEDDD